MSDWTDETIDWYAENFGDDPTVFAMLDVVPVPGTAAVLDVGCGTGSALRALVGRTTGALAGVDPFARMIGHAERLTKAAGLGARIDFSVAPAEALGMPDTGFDVVLALNAIHHWADINAGLAEAFRVLRPGGVLAIGGEKFGVDALGRAQDYTAELAQAGFVPGDATRSSDLFYQLSHKAPK